MKFLSKDVEKLEASDVREILKLLEKPGVISFAGGLPDPSTFPREELAEIARSVILEKGKAALQYAPSRGVREFIDAVKRFMERHGVYIRGEDAIIATVGSQEALYMLSEVLIDPGDVVIVEKPTYLAAVQVFRKRGARFEPIELDEDGMRVDLLEERLKRLASEGKRVKLVYLVPTCQNPTGVTMSYERRKYLLELASRYDFLVIEDDPYGLITFEERSVQPLKTLDREGRVVYLGSLSKVLAPGLRLGWAAGPEEIISVIEKLKQHVNLHASTLTQYIAAKALDGGIVERNLARVRELYRMKRDVMLEALEEYFPRGSRWTRPIGGLFIFVWLPEGVDTRALLPKAIERGVAYVPGSAFYVDGSGVNTMRLNYSYPSVEEIREGIKRLGRLLREELEGKTG
nr:PLP-dependent aminotransferase family protein [Pyrolobus fumarii]